MHVPSTMNNVVPGNESLIMFAAIAANYTVTGTALQTDTFENSDRLQNVVINSNIANVTYTISIRGTTTPATIEYSIFKVERASTVPVDDGVLLPTNTEIATEGLQAALRKHQPGRVIKFGAFATAEAQPRVVTVNGNYAKFKLSKLRTGDFYGIIIFNRGGADVIMDVQARFKSTR